MNNRTVSICIPVYNGANYLESAILSALAQDYPNIEIIVVNDGSTDQGQTERIAKSFGKKIRYILQENRGVAGALNTAIKAATGDYFAWLSHDDLHLPHKTSAQINYLSQLGRPDACLFSDYDLIDPDNNVITTVRLPPDRIRKSPRLPLLNGWINGCSLLIPIRLLKQFGPFDERLRFTQDYDLWNKMLEHHEFFHQPSVLIQYRIHPQQDSQAQKVGPESNILWRRMIDDRSMTQRAQMAGSSQRFYESVGEFLKPTPMREASDYAFCKARNATNRTLTSVVIPFFNEIDLVHRAVESVRNQVDANIEVILVNDGSTEDIDSLKGLAERDRRIKVVSQPNRGAAAARNRGLMSVRGEYVAFLDADDTFMPHKVRRQIELMQQSGALFSHTSYYVCYPGKKETLGIIRSGQVSGACYPNLIASCPIAMPTVILHRAIIDEGFEFPAGYRIGEDMLAWIDLASKYLILGIDEPLSIVEWQETSAAMSLVKQIDGVTGALGLLADHPIHGRQADALQRLKSYLAFLKEQRRGVQSDNWGEPLIRLAWQGPTGVPLEAAGRLK